MLKFYEKIGQYIKNQSKRDYQLNLCRKHIKITHNAFFT